ncbi:holo-ACP synthase [Rahnella sp. PD12R]|uniref:holo-ACP synthase n=1 Tax=Rahnella sp. PD12R TaxID=2855688 RepID=UPI001C466C90|nr:holo-ACP synthase [Rahnella sp. PD12R]MBV6817858.1 holo-ACP synthase [Rahnella sp. PD12R]
MFVGTDIVEVERVKTAILRGGDNFLQRVFTQRELISINSHDPDYERAAGFWAAKESVVKSVGLGFREGIRFHDAEIEHDQFGCPHFVLRGHLKDVMEDKKINAISLSISHCRTHAIAVTVISSRRD